MDEIFENEIIDSMGENEQGTPQLKNCLICGETFLDDGESGCCMIDS